MGRVLPAGELRELSSAGALQAHILQSVMFKHLESTELVRRTLPTY